MKEFLQGAALAPLVLLFWVGGPITYILNVVDTWKGDASIFMKLLVNLTLDAFLAAIWPITWILWWLIPSWQSPLETVLGWR